MYRTLPDPPPLRTRPNFDTVAPMNDHWMAQFPMARPRRLRQSPAIRRLVTETRLHPDQLVLPFFVRTGRKIRRPVNAMPGVFQLSVDELTKDAARAFATGLRAVLLFGIPEKKYDRASGAYAANGINKPPVRQLKRSLPQLFASTDGC